MPHSFFIYLPLIGSSLYCISVYNMFKCFTVTARYLMKNIFYTFSITWETGYCDDVERISSRFSNNYEVKLQNYLKILKKCFLDATCIMMKSSKFRTYVFDHWHVTTDMWPPGGWSSDASKSRPEKYSQLKLTLLYCKEYTYNNKYNNTLIIINHSSIITAV